MNPHRAIILEGLQELSNASASGRKCCVTFEANGNEHWLRCTPSRLNMDWPFASAPSESGDLEACFGHGLKIDAWEADSYVTFVPLCRDVDSLVLGIDRAFQDLYGLGTGYGLSYKIEES